MSPYEGDEPEMTREEFLARQRAGTPAHIVRAKTDYEAAVQASAEPRGFTLGAIEVHAASGLVVGEFSGRIEGDRFTDLRGIVLSGARNPA